MPARAIVPIFLVVLLVQASACKQDLSISRDLGAACQNNGDCTTRCLPDPRWPNGLCSLDCAKDQDCPGTAVCVSTAADGPVCLFSCLDDRDCDFLTSTINGATWACQPLDGRLACAAAHLPDAGTAD